MNKEKLISSCIEYQKTNHPRRTSRYDKCERDLGYIIEALENDIKNNTTIFTHRIGNYFWYDGERQIGNYSVELDVYKHLLSEIEQQEDNATYTKALASINLLCDIIENGTLATDDVGSNLIEAARKAEHCQRNWDKTFVVPDQDVDALVKVATTMPSKQNRTYFGLIVSTDPELNRFIYNNSIDQQNPDTFDRNSQSDANMLFLYVESRDIGTNAINHHKENHKINLKTSVGISSGALALAATQLDYRVGFCQCYLNNVILDEIRKRGVELPEEFGGIELIVGVGKRNSDHHWTTVLNDNNEFVRKVEIHTKTIKTVLL